MRKEKMGGEEGVVSEREYKIGIHGRRCNDEQCLV